MQPLSRYGLASLRILNTYDGGEAGGVTSPHASRVIFVSVVNSYTANC
jgi:hypothetical protein